MVDKTVGVLTLIVGLASLAVIVSKKSNTAAVLNASLGGFSSLIRSAISPVTGK